MEDEEILGLYQLFLDAGRSDVDVISTADRCLHQDREYDQRSPSVGCGKKIMALTPPPVPVTHPQL